MSAVRIVMAVAILLLGSGPRLSAQESKGDPSSACVAGTRLTAERAQALETLLTSQADDLNARAQLLGYYSTRQHRNKQAAQAHVQHVLWLVNQHPGHELTGTTWARVLRSTTPEGYDRVKAAWLEQVAKAPGDTSVLANAASALALDDAPQAEALLAQAAQADPVSAQWPDRLAEVLRIHAPRAPPAEQKDLLARCLQQREKALQLTSAPLDRFDVLTGLPAAAVDAGEYDKAADYARELLNTAPQYRDNWNYGNAVHRANIALGHVALHKDDVAKARQFLAEAAKTPGSPQLDAYGPDFTLARALLERGERKAVLSYLAEVKRFWSTGQDQLDTWSADIQQGRTPRLDPLTGE
jgi:tetratricopeptide (TPR) repeat protein